MTEHFREVLRKSEIKRSAERLTKKELCNIYGFNYNFYMNCISGRNYPSKNMVELLEEYLRTNTQDIYRMVFSSRPQEKEFHDALEINESEVSALKGQLSQDGVLEEPV